MDLDLSKIEGFYWDQGNLEHIKKHDVEANECEEVFFNKPIIINSDETHSQTEDRFRVYGVTDEGRLLVIIYTVRNNKIRVVSARDQNKRERKEYKETGGEIV